MVTTLYVKFVSLIWLQHDSEVSVVSVSEFATPSAFLSMAVLEAGLKKVNESERAEEANSASDSDDDDEERAVVQKEAS